VEQGLRVAGDFCVTISDTGQLLSSTKADTRVCQAWLHTEFLMEPPHSLCGRTYRMNAEEVEAWDMLAQNSAARRTTRAPSLSDVSELYCLTLEAAHLEESRKGPTLLPGTRMRIVFATMGEKERGTGSRLAAAVEKSQCHSTKAIAMYQDKLEYRIFRDTLVDLGLEVINPRGAPNGAQARACFMRFN
jgi:hypothetical protein